MEVSFYSNADDICPIAEFIREVPAKAKKKIIRNLRLVETYGHEALESLDLRKYADHGIWEMKIRFNKIAYRIFFVIRNGVVWLLHAFIKQSQKTPIREIRTALKRLIDLDTRVLSLHTR